LEARAEEAVFVGVDHQSKGYRVYWPRKRRMSVEWNVVFVLEQMSVAVDVPDEGESHPDAATTTPAPAPVPSTVQNTVPPTPTTPPRPPMVLEIPPTPRPTHITYPPGYYSTLNNGTLAALSAEVEPKEELVDDEPNDERLTHLYALAAVEPEPTLQQVLNGPDTEEWKEAIGYELSQLEKLGTWKVVDAPVSINLIPCHYVLATKCEPDREKLKLCARLVANGCRQQYGINYYDTFTPTSNMSTIWTVLAKAAKLDWEIH
jgi:hypothetical protein